VIDCDTHQNFNSTRDLLPWVDPAFRDYLDQGGYRGYELPNYPWVHPQGFMMGDAVPPGGGVPGSDYETLREQLLDRHDIEYAILTGEEILNVSCMPHAPFAAALARAYNRWMMDTWLPRDDRLRGSLVVATQDAETAAAEIRRTGGDPAIVQVIVSCGALTGYGDRRYWPIYEAAVEMGLPVAMHVGAEGLGMNPPPTATGYPSFYLDWHALLPTTVMSHIASLVVHGVFERFPELRIVIIEAGVAWLAPLLWRLDANWKALRSEAPWMVRAPSETVREHLRFTTQPLEQPADGRHLHQALDMVDGIEDMLMFATDYPHWDFDSPQLVQRRLPAAWRDKVMSENARALYGLQVREPLDRAA
jgi:predicted TIM-barrel fold metal-dependent hydrolase